MAKLKVKGKVTDLGLWETDKHAALAHDVAAIAYGVSTLTSAGPHAGSWLN